jgi:O-antigen/teichoic acid export membrane protein
VRLEPAAGAALSQSPLPSSLPLDAEHYFRTDELESDLRGRSVRGGVASLAGQSGKFALSVAAMAVLARLLRPEDFGLLAMVMAVTTFVALFRDLGLAMPTIQQQQINHRQISTLFWVNVAFGVLLTAGVAALAPALAWFYKEPRLRGIAVAMSAAFVIGGLSVQHQALLRRQMRFAALAIVDVISVAVAGAVAIIAAALGAGYWALVILQLVMVLGATVGAWIVCRWRPGMPVRHAGIRSMLAFGGNVAGANMLSAAVRNLDKVLVGWRFSAAPLGLYNVAYQLLLLPMSQINIPLTTVAIPALSRLQGQPDRYRLFYQKGIQLLCAIGMPVVVFMFVAADRLVLTVLGGQWTQSVPIFRVLAPAALVGTFEVATRWVYISLGQTHRQLRFTAVATAATIAAFALGLRWGPIGVAAGLSIAVCGLRLPDIIYCFRTTSLRTMDLLSALWRPMLTSAAAGAALYAFDRLVIWSPSPVISLLIDAAVYAIGYALCWLLVPHGRQIIAETIQLARDLRPAKESHGDGGAGQS